MAILELKNISKNFGGVRALRGVNLELRQGEIHGLMGENGAGKSTTIKVITGVHQPNEGEIYLDGKKLSSKIPRWGVNSELQRFINMLQHSPLERNGKYFHGS